MKNFSFQLLSLVMLISSSLICCEDEREIFEEPKDEPALALTSFSFKDENNKLLSKAYNAVITDKQIEVTMPSITKNLIATFVTNASKVTVNGIEQTSNVTINDFSKPVTYTLVSESGKITETYTLKFNWTSPIPHINIVTEQNADIVSKDDYINADIEITANGWGEDFTGKTRIRGRGNTTWVLPKKPYRLKLDEDAVILGLAEEKDWVLLANIIDPTLMLNAVAFKIGDLLDLKYTNHAIPVDLTLNGKYVGSYMLTEQVERSSSRVDIHKEKGVLLEIDGNFDEDYQFLSNNYALPIMIKDPDLDDFSTEEAAELFDNIKSDFHQLEDAIASDQFPNSNYKNYIDIQSLVKFLIVFDLTHNMEINHPKSTYMHKDETGKYFMGPIWDFDWAFGYEGNRIHFQSFNTPLFKLITPNSKGYYFFTRIMEDPEVKALYKEIWQKFSTESMEPLLEYVDFYSAHLTESQAKDYQVWSVVPDFPGTLNYSLKINQLKTWLKGRATYIDNYVNDF